MAGLYGDDLKIYHGFNLSLVYNIIGYPLKIYSPTGHNFFQLPQKNNKLATLSVVGDNKDTYNKSPYENNQNKCRDKFSNYRFADNS